MQTYKEYRPTGFDPKGLNGESNGISDFLVIPCGRNRDSRCLEESNFHAALAMLGGESEPVSDDDNGPVQIHRFGHWACGWFEIILVKPGTPQAAMAEVIEAKLENYPVLDDDDYSSREFEAAEETWKNCYNVKERVEMLQEQGLCIYAARRDEMPQGFDYSRFEL